MRSVGSSTQRLLFRGVTATDPVQPISFTGDGSKKGGKFLLKKQSKKDPRVAALILNIRLGIEQLGKDRRYTFSDFTKYLKTVVSNCYQLMGFVKESLKALQGSMRTFDLNEAAQGASFYRALNPIHLASWEERCVEVENTLVDLQEIIKQKFKEDSLKLLVFSPRILPFTLDESKAGEEYKEFLEEVRAFKVYFSEEAKGIRDALSILNKRFKEIVQREISMNERIRRGVILKKRSSKDERNVSLKHEKFQYEKKESALKAVMSRCELLSKKGIQYLHSLSAAPNKLSPQKKATIEAFLNEFSLEMSDLQQGILAFEKVESKDFSSRNAQSVLDQSLKILSTMDQLQPVLKAKIHLGDPHASTQKVFQKRTKKKG